MTQAFREIAETYHKSRDDGPKTEAKNRKKDNHQRSTITNDMLLCDVPESSIDSGPLPCENFNRFYLPNGKQVFRSVETREKLKRSVYEVNLKRDKLDYEKEAEGEVYHLVKDRSLNGKYHIEPNVVMPHLNLQSTPKASVFSKYVPRKDKDVLLSLNDSRFDTKETPKIATSTKRVPNLVFDK